MAVEWFAVLKGKTLGPFTPDQLRGLVREGKVTRETRVRKGQDGDWVLADRVQRLFDAPEAAVEEDQVVPLVPADVLIEEAMSSTSGGHPPLPPLPSESSSQTAIPVPVPTAITGELVYLSEQGVIVTDRCLQTGDGTVCAVGQIAMVRRGKGPRKAPWLAVASLLVGIGFLFDAIPSEPANTGPRRPAATPAPSFLPLLGFMALAYGVYSLAGRKPGPWLLVSLSSGEVKEVNHPDPAFLDRVRDALSWAIRSGP